MLSVLYSSTIQRLIPFELPNLTSSLVGYEVLEYNPVNCTAARTGIIEPPAGTLELPLLVMSGSSFFFAVLS